jgi:hypothetical protein
MDVNPKTPLKNNKRKREKPAFMKWLCNWFDSVIFFANYPKVGASIHRRPYTLQNKNIKIQNSWILKILALCPDITIQSQDSNFLWSKSAITIICIDPQFETVIIVVLRSILEILLLGWWHHRDQDSISKSTLIEIWK